VGEWVGGRVGMDGWLGGRVWVGVGCVYLCGDVGVPLCMSVECVIDHAIVKLRMASELESLSWTLTCQRRARARPLPGSA